MSWAKTIELTQLTDLEDAEMDPPVRLEFRAPIACVDVPEWSCDSQFPDRMIDGRVGRAERRTE